MDIEALKILGSIAGVVGASLTAILLFAVRAARQNQNTLLDSVKILKEDRDFYRGEFHKTQTEVANLKVQMDSLRRDHTNATSRLELLVEQLDDQLRTSQQNRAALQIELDASRQRETEMKAEIDTLKVEKMAMQQEIMTLRAELQALREKLEARDAPKANGQVATVPNEVNGP